MEIQLINDELLSELRKQAQSSERKRQNFDMRNTSEDTSQRMLNVLEVGTRIPIHRHLKTSESVICLKGSLDWVFYEELPTVDSGECFKEVARFRLCPREGKYGIQLPKMMWHSIEVYEPSTIFEAKDGAFVPQK